MIRGIDVSDHQNRVDWTRVTAEAVSFACLKEPEGTQEHEAL
jgi:GH25 family lysozyme M1 (1,4-beta-N-acetylmuramidase)